jgi:hypothetical protein
VRDIVTMIDRVVGNKPIPMGTRQDIIERTDGIPLFVEEMTKAVLEAGSEGDARMTAAADPSSALAECPRACTSPRRLIASPGTGSCQPKTGMPEERAAAV